LRRKIMNRGDRGGHYDSIVLFSGGPDSSALLYYVKDELGEQPLALHVSTGLAPNTLEFGAAKKVAAVAGVPVQAIDISHFVAAAGGGMITIHSEAHALRFGTAVLLSMASAFAIQSMIKKVYVALHKEDADEATEYSPAFIEYINSGLSLIGEECQVIAPFHGWQKADVLSKALALGVPISETWSCVGGRDRV
jgi:7-cyano-7-deazaguanine synthase